MFNIIKPDNIFIVGKKHFSIEEAKDFFLKKKHLNNIDLHSSLELFYSYLYKTEQNFSCAICGCKASHYRITKVKDNYHLHLFGFKKDKNNNCNYVFFNKDHIFPKSKFKNGNNSAYNLQLTCLDCNLNKGNNFTEEEKNNFYEKKLKMIVNQKIHHFLKTAINVNDNGEFGNMKSCIKDLIANHYEEIESLIINKLNLNIILEKDFK